MSADVLRPCECGHDYDQHARGAADYRAGIHGCFRCQDCKSFRSALTEQARLMAQRYIDGQANDPLTDEIALALFAAHYGYTMDREAPQVCRIGIYEHSIVAANTTRPLLMPRPSLDELLAGTEFEGLLDPPPFVADHPDHDRG